MASPWELAAVGVPHGRALTRGLRVPCATITIKSPDDHA